MEKVVDIVVGKNGPIVLFNSQKECIDAAKQIKEADGPKILCRPGPFFLSFCIFLIKKAKMFLSEHFYQIASNQMDIYLYNRERWMEDRKEERRFWPEKNKN